MITHTDGAKQEGGTGDKDDDLPKEATIQAEARATSSEGQVGEGSIGYRIAAMVAMFLLALAGFLFWFFSRK